MLNKVILVYSFLFFFCMISNAQIRKISYAIMNDSLVTHFYEEDNIVSARGVINKSKKKIGKWIYYDKKGNIICVACFSKEGENIGKWNFYKDNKLTKRVIFLRNNKFAVVREKGKGAKRIERDKVSPPIILEQIE